jgi:hypothetical protein
MPLSVCLLTRNEEKNIARAIRSVAGAADEVLVTDTGSSDRTVELARHLGARVIDYAWKDDFAAARDHAIAHAWHDWILWLNPDEELLPESFEPLSECSTRVDALGFYALVTDIHRLEQPSSFSETAQLRLFRRRPDVHSVGRLHPVFMPSFEEIAGREGKQVAYAKIAIRRHAYLSQLDEGKLRWSLRLLELELRDRPGQLHYLVEYGRALLLANNPKGHEVLAEAVEQIIAVRKAAAAPLPEVQRLLEYVLTVDPAQSRSRLSRDEARALALRWFPNSPPILWQIAQHHFQAGEFRQASRLLEKLVDLGRSGAYDRSEGFDPTIVGEPALMNLGACHTRLREFDKAEACFLQLLNGDRFREKAAQNLAVVQALRSQGAAPDSST